MKIEKGMILFWNDPDNGICSGKVKVIKVKEETAICDKGEFPLNELEELTKEETVIVFEDGENATN